MVSVLLFVSADVHACLTYLVISAQDILAKDVKEFSKECSNSGIIYSHCLIQSCQTVGIVLNDICNSFAIGLIQNMGNQTKNLTTEG
jgi:hypothetical protein